MAYTSSKLLWIAVMVLGIFIVITMSCSQYVPYSTETNYVKFEEGMSTISPQVISPPPSETLMNVSGFSGWYSSSDSSSSNIDSFMSTKASSVCEKSNLSSSGGFLCLSENQKTLLRTRGGNA